MFITCSKWVSDKAGEKEKKHLWILSCTVSNTISRANVSLVSVFCIDETSLVITSPITSKYFTSIFSSTIPSSHPSLLLESRAFSISYPIEIIFPTNLFFANRVAIFLFTNFFISYFSFSFLSHLLFIHCEFSRNFWRRKRGAIKDGVSRSPSGKRERVYGARNAWHAATCVIAAVN